MPSPNRCAVASLPDPSPPSNGRVIFLDRDGVINRQRPEHVTSWEDFEFLPGVLDTLAELTRLNIPLVVVTNQSAVGRGLLDHDELAGIHQRMVAEIHAHGGVIAAVYACTHVPEAGCKCRKPGTELFHRASADLGINLAGSMMIGDSPTDGEAAISVGCKAILVGPAQPLDGSIAAPDLPAAAAIACELLVSEALEAC
jgi:histidinol-phosphate phosphatase family protein